MPQRTKLAVYDTIARIRPEQLGALAKGALGIKRRHVRDAKGRTFWIDPVTALGRSLLRDGVYEPRMQALVEQLLAPADTFVDLGANEGYFSVLAASVARDGRVHSVEPQSKLREVLLENARANGAGNMTVHTLAISDQKGTAQLFVRSSINQDRSRLNTAFKLGFGAELVPTTTLEEFCAANRIVRARMLKMDCEGAEVPIMAASPAVFQRQTFDVIALEYHPPIITAEDCRKIHAQLTAAGYRLAKWSGQTIYYVDSAAAALAAISAEIRLDASL